MTRTGIFEVDCREKALNGDGLSFVPRAEPFSERIHRIHELVKDAELPFVFTTCCADRLPTKADPAGALVVPMDEDDREWVDELPGAKPICIEKTTWGSPKANTVHCAWDMFRHNGNARRLIEELGVRRWIVYGVGIDLCVSSAAKGLLAAGCKVVILDDILTNNAGGSPESMRRMLDDLGEMGVETMASEDFLAAASAV